MVETESFRNEMMRERIQKPLMEAIAPNNFRKLKKKKVNNSRFPNGQIFITLKKNKLSYFPGETVEGSILVQQQMPFKAAELRLTFKGVEKATYNAYEEIKKPAKSFGKQVVASKATH